MKELDVDKGNPGTAYKNALANYDINTVLKAEIINSQGLSASSGSNDFYKANNFYLFDYNFPISTIVGGIIAWILIGFCLDLSVRVVKLGFLQIIAPIPIILSLAPTQKNNTLGNWGRECISTWASLFVRVMVISFALSAIITINTDGGIFSFVTGGTNQFSIVTVFVMIGILLFAKEFPKLLEDILGIKGAGKMTFNALKKLTEAPIIGGAVGAGAAFAGAGVHWAGNTLKNKTLSAGERLFADRFKKDVNGNPLTAKDRADLRQERYEARQKANAAEFQGRRYADPTKKYSGDTQAKIMRKQNAENRKTLNENEKQYRTGEELYAKTLDEKGNEIKGEKYKIYNSKEFSDAVQKMDVLKERRDTISGEAEKLRMRQAAGEEVKYGELTGEAAVQAAVVEAKKAEGAFNDAKAAFDNVKVRHKSDSERYTAFSAAENRHKITEKYNEYEEAGGKISVTESFKQMDSNGNRMDRMENAIVGAINQGFANMNDSSKQVNGVKVTPTSAGEYRTPSGIYVPGSAVNSGVNNPTSVPQNNPQSTTPQSGSQPPKTGFAGSPTDRTTKGGQNQ